MLTFGGGGGGGGGGSPAAAAAPAAGGGAKEAKKAPCYFRTAAPQPPAPFEAPTPYDGKVHQQKQNPDFFKLLVKSVFDRFGSNPVACVVLGSFEEVTFSKKNRGRFFPRSDFVGK